MFKEGIDVIEINNKRDFDIIVLDLAADEEEIDNVVNNKLIIAIDTQISSRSCYIVIWNYLRECRKEVLSIL